MFARTTPNHYHTEQIYMLSRYYDQHVKSQHTAAHDTTHIQAGYLRAQAGKHTDSVQSIVLGSAHRNYFGKASRWAQPNAMPCIDHRSTTHNH